MPELPEVETVRADLATVLKNKKVLEVEVLSSKSAQPSPEFLTNKLVGASFLGADRLGKLLIFPLNNKLFLLVHLRMTGQLIYADKKVSRVGGHSLHGKKEDLSTANLPNRHTRIILKLSGGATLYFNDLRKFGFLRLVDNDGLSLAKKSFGVEPLSSEFTEARLREMLKGRKQKIKPFLLNQKFIAGLGNIYVDEALFAAKIRPDRLASSLTGTNAKNLHSTIQKIIKLAIKMRGTTFSNYRDGRGGKGNFSTKLQVYGRSGENCPVCGGKIKKMKLFGRGTHFCEHCQK
ncbi:MAG: DNA-formamidopyrimidine glycosylase [Candidatus Falkowbacteria bacterium]|nr:DNA-formamidopyrimidine glycosylase [Candidatus Falkowbacteria bacterium]